MPLTAYKSLTLSPTVAPDGRVAYVTYKGGAPEIWGQRTAGGPHMRLSMIGKSPSWIVDPISSLTSFRISPMIS